MEGQEGQIPRRQSHKYSYGHGAVGTRAAVDMGGGTVNGGEGMKRCKVIWKGRDVNESQTKPIRRQEWRVHLWTLA